MSAPKNIISVSTKATTPSTLLGTSFFRSTGVDPVDDTVAACIEYCFSDRRRANRHHDLRHVHHRHHHDELVFLPLLALGKDSPNLSLMVS